MIKFDKVTWEDGEGGSWVLPFLGISWTEGRIQIWAGWIYWMVRISFAKVK
jgi:hypothetical protein